MVVLEVPVGTCNALGISDAGTLRHAIHGKPGHRMIEHRVLLAAIRKGRSNVDAMNMLRGIWQECEFHRTVRSAREACSAPPVRSKELEKRLAVIRAKNEEETYSRMVQDVSTQSLSTAQTESLRLGRIGAQMSIGANVLVTMITCFVTGYFAFKHSSGSEAVGLVGGLICMMVALGVEATLVITRMYSIESAAEKDAKKRAANVVT